MRLFGDNENVHAYAVTCHLCGEYVLFSTPQVEEIISRLRNLCTIISTKKTITTA